MSILFLKPNLFIVLLGLIQNKISFLILLLFENQKCIIIEKIKKKA